jgi:hypothetical protein
VSEAGFSQNASLPEPTLSGRRRSSPRGVIVTAKMTSVRVSIRDFGRLSGIVSWRTFFIV